MNKKQVEKSRALLGNETVDMLLQVHKDAMWILENLGMGCRQPEMQRTFQQFEKEGLAIVYDDRIFLTAELIEKFRIDSLRAEITLFEAARAHAAADGRTEVYAEDLRQTGLMALRFRRSNFMNEYINQQQTEDGEIISLLNKTIKSNQTGEFKHAI